MRNIIIAISSLRLIPHLILLVLHTNRAVIKYEIIRWLDILKLSKGTYAGFLTLMTFYPEYRNLYYYRIGNFQYAIRFLCPKVNTLFINTAHIGPGLFIQHGFATIIAAQTIGKNCWINQQVTIGFADDKSQPIIKDNVYISAGSKIIGNVTVGTNTKVGANAVVVKNVPDNCTVVGIPAYIVKKDGIRVNQKL